MEFLLLPPSQVSFLVTFVVFCCHLPFILGKRIPLINAEMLKHCSKGLFVSAPVSMRSPPVICVMVILFESGHSWFHTLTLLPLSRCARSPDMLQSEVSFSLGGRHSSTDSNKASSGDISPYDNNSPVLPERSLLAMQEDRAPGGSEKLYKVPEQYMLVGHLPSSKSKSRESSPGPRLGKGNGSLAGPDQAK